MRNKTDLDGALVSDEGSFHTRLHEAIARGQLQKPWEIRATLQSFATSASPCVARLSRGSPLRAEEIDGICAEIASQIIEKYGNNPTGYLRVKAYTKGLSVTPEVEINRTIDVGLFSVEDTQIAILQAQLVVERNNNFRKDEVIAQLVQQLTAQAAQAHQTTSATISAFTQVASVRAQVGAAGEAGQLHSALGLLMLVMVIPALREAFHFPDDMPLEQIVKLGMTRFRRFVGIERKPKLSPPAGRRPPEAALDDAPDDTPDDAADDAPDDALDDAPDAGNVTTRPTPAQIVEWVAVDPAWAYEVVQALKSDSRTAQLLTLAGA